MNEEQLFHEVCVKVKDRLPSVSGVYFVFINGKMRNCNYKRDYRSFEEDNEDGTWWNLAEIDYWLLETERVVLTESQFSNILRNSFETAALLFSKSDREIKTKAAMWYKDIFQK